MTSRKSNITKPSMNIKYSHQGNLTSSFKTDRALSEKNETAMPIWRDRLPATVGISSSPALPVEGRCAAQGRHNRQTSSEWSGPHPALHLASASFIPCVLFGFRIKSGRRKKMGVLPCVSFKRHKPSGSVLFFCGNDCNNAPLILEAERSAEGWMAARTVPQ